MLNGKLIGIAVFPPSMFVLGLTCHLEEAAKYDDIKEAVKQSSKGPLKGIVSYTEDQIVS